ncbi:MAG: GntR family transcriptional regulator, partial [Pseudomonadota bacterium]
MISAKIKKYTFKPSVIGEQISRVLTEAILEGILKGGDQLVELELQKHFGISRSPLREAFRDLEKKGLVVIVPRKGTFVKQITRE